VDKSVWRGVLTAAAAMVSILLAVAGFGINGLGLSNPRRPSGGLSDFQTGTSLNCGDDGARVRG
jgi:hypothetical protein